MRKTRNDLEIRRREYEIAGVIQAAGLQLSEFEWKPRLSMFSGTLIHRATDERFEFHADGGDVIKCTLPGTGGQVRHRAVASVNWDARYEAFIEWVTALRQWIVDLEEYSNTPDLWAALHKESLMTEGLDSPDLNNKSFTVDEQKYLAGQLNELKAFIMSNNDLQAEQSARVERSIRYLLEASPRLGRKDWLAVGFSVLVSLVVSGIYAPDRAHELFGVAVRLLQPLYKSVLSLRAGG